MTGSTLASDDLSVYASPVIFDPRLAYQRMVFSAQNVTLSK
ncbi:hypothetical protein GcM1_236116, partial [Golovinomyces cichoracearum]